ncbi:MFS transporter [Agarivorans sp. QJM3NY_25]|uniref:MFS transporter n=1 Tax=Agarivorans sp. QJM3NY_25 TaxID=3421430 RepID=UPI003D7C55D7
MNNSSLLDSAVHKSMVRLVPLMLLLYILAFLDRANIGVAKVQYMADTGIGSAAFASGASIFFLAYAFLGAPCNLLMKKVGAKRWIAFTTILWGLVSCSLAIADTETKFVTTRFLLGATEAGFFPGMIYLTSLWFPQKNRGTIIGMFYVGPCIALALGTPFSGALLEGLHGWLGHPGWFWMFLVEGLLAAAVGVFVYFYLDSEPKHARFLNDGERKALMRELSQEEQKSVASRISDAIKIPRVWALAIAYGVIQLSVYGLAFYLPSTVAKLISSVNVTFISTLVAAIPWVVAGFATYYIPRYAAKRFAEAHYAALVLTIAGIGVIGSAVLSASPVASIFCLSLAASGFIAVQPMFWTMPSAILSGSALAAGIGFVNMFGAFGGALGAPVREFAEPIFGNPMAPQIVMGVTAIFGAILIYSLRPQQAGSQQPIAEEVIAK